MNFLYELIKFLSPEEIEEDIPVATKDGNIDPVMNSLYIHFLTKQPEYLKRASISYSSCVVYKWGLTRHSNSFLNKYRAPRN